MIWVASVLALLAAGLHVYIFILESLRWEQPATRKTFRTSESEAAATKEMAYNQGFYNLFLALMTLVGIILLATGATGVGAALVFAGTGSMLLAAVVLITRSPTLARAAVTQGTLPLLAVISLIVALAL